MNHSQFKKEALSRTGVKQEYDALIPEFNLLREMLKARNDAGLSQAEVAELMGTKAPAITRLESSLTSGKHSPSVATLKKYAMAVGCNLEIKFTH
jgi:transcriptional regulator with XRE-family HTH domain